MKPSANGARGGGRKSLAGGKKTADAIHHEVAQEVDRLLQVVFRDQRQTGRLDLEAVEMAVRSALHRAGAAAADELLRFPAPAPTAHPSLSLWPTAHYRSCRTKPVLTALGPVQVSRPTTGARLSRRPIPADVELDIENTEFSPGVTAHAGAGGPGGPLRSRREQMKVLAGLEVTAKSVERTAEALGADIAQREQGEIPKTLPWTFPSSRLSRFPSCTCK